MQQASPERFRDQVVLVTGASSGIGRAIALRAAAEGATVVVGYGHDTAGAAEVVREAEKAGGRAIALMGDLAKPADARRIIDHAAVEFGRLDVLVTSHGIVRRGKLAEITEEMWDDVLDVNLKGVFFVCQAAAEVMLRQGRGAIVNISSMRGVEGSASSAHYAAAKAGVIALTKSLARELAPVVRVNSVAPGYVETRIQAGLTAEQRREIERTTPLARIGKPEEIAATALFLASADAAFVTGQTLLVDGGRVMC